MQTRINGKLTIRNGRLSLWDGIRIENGAEVEIRDKGVIFTYETTSNGLLSGNGTIYVHKLFRYVQGTINEILKVIYYGTLGLLYREIQIMDGSITMTKDATKNSEYDLWD
jgi:hypothetical protein